MEARLAALEDRLRQTEDVLEQLRQVSKRWECLKALSAREQSQNLLRSVVTLIRTVSSKECLGHSGASSSAVTLERSILVQHDVYSKWRRKWRIQQSLTTRP